MSKKHFIFKMSACMFMLSGLFSVVSAEKSLYAIRQHYSTDTAAYKIQDDEIAFQTSQSVGGSASGGVGMALDENSGTLFFSYDGSSTIKLADAFSMKSLTGNFFAPGEVAGMVFDSDNSVLLAIHRETEELYKFIFDSNDKILSLSNTFSLEYIDDQKGAYDIALDENDTAGRKIYVTDMTNVVKVYDADDPNYAYLGGIEIEVDGNDRQAVAVAVYNDGAGTRYLYTGAYVHSGLHNYLVRTDLNDPCDPCSFSEAYAGASVIGLSVDEDTGLVYQTTYYLGGFRALASDNA